jgi:hypothetical protein
MYSKTVDSEIKQGRERIFEKVDQFPVSNPSTCAGNSA